MAADSPSVPTLTGPARPHRPVLNPALRPVWRDPTTLQLGVDPRHALVLEALTPPLAAVIGLLDGTRDREQVLAEAARRGADPADVVTLLDHLAAGGALVDAARPPVRPALPADEQARLAPDAAGLSLLGPDGVAADVLARRRGALVVVAGAGRVGGMVAGLLAAAGVGRLRLRDPATSSAAGDAAPGGCPAGGSATPRVLRVAEEVARGRQVRVDAAARELSPRDCERADLVVVAPEPYQAPDDLATAALRGTGARHLVAGVRETVGVVGPLVVPGRTSCAGCHDLARADRDPAWPAVAVRLAVRRPAGAEACDVVLAAATAALAAGQALTVLAGPGPVLVADATLELRLPEWSLRRRVWVPHPDCRCGAAVRPAEPTGAVGW